MLSFIPLSLNSLMDSGGVVENEFKNTVSKLVRFVNAIASGAVVSGRQARQVNKASAKINEMSKHLSSAESDIIKTQSIELPSRSFLGDDLLLSSVEGKTRSPTTTKEPKCTQAAPEKEKNESS